MWTRTKTYLTYSLYLLCAAALLRAQLADGEIVGTVKDTSGAVVSGAAVTVRNLETNITRSSPTDAKGNFAFPSLRIGLYEVTASLEGFKVTVVPSVELKVADRKRIDPVLEPGAITEQIDVVAAAPLLETDTSSRGQVVEGAEIRELPLNKRDYTQLALLAPGTTREPRHRLGGAMNINGNRALQNNFLLDGADNNSNATSYRGERVDVIRPSVDAVAEFKLMTNNYSAQFGRSAGAVVNVTIKSGTNSFHGAGWEFFRNDRLDAHGWTPTRPADLKRKLRFNLFGANIGGPLVKDKTFFFANYEGERERNGQTYINAVPTLALQRGDFNDLAGAPSHVRPVPVDPETGAPFPGNVIPESRWDPVTAIVLSDPNFPQPTSPGFSNNFNSTRTDSSRSDKFDVRIDHAVNDQWRLFGRYSFSDFKRFRPTIFQGLPEGSTNDAFGTTATRGQNVVFGPTVILSPTTLLEARVAYTRLGANVFPANFGSPPPGELLGIPNLPTDPGVIGGWPMLDVNGFNRFGRTTSTPQFQIPNVYQYKATLSMLKGAHSMKFGADNMHIYTAIMDVSATIGRFRFRKDGFSGNAWGDFLLGLPARIRMTSPTVIYNQTRIHSVFFQDDFRLRPGLTLNLGLRYEYGQPITEKFNRLANFNPSTGEKSFATDGSIAQRALVQPDRNDFSPRVGFAWTARPGLVLRGGYGIFYNHTNRQGREGLLGMNNPFVADLERRQRLGQTPEPITLSSGPPADFLSNVREVDQINRGNDPNLRSAYVQQWNMTLQAEPLENWLFEIGYVGNRGNKLTRFFDANQAHQPGPPNDLQLRRPFPSFGEIQYMDSGGTSNYHALQTRVERRFAGGLSLLHSFTYGRSLENVGAWGEEQSGGGRRPQNAYDFANEYGLAGTSVKLRSVMSWVYQLPFGAGKRYMTAAHPVAEAMLGGWELSGIWSWQSGLPVNIRSSECGAACDLGGQRRERADALFDARIDNPTPAMWFDTAAFQEPAGPFGSASRNSVYGPGIHNWDLSFMKRFQVSERTSFQFRTEFFNVFNQVNFDRPANNVSSSNFGKVSTAAAGRSIQFGLKLYW